MNWADLAHRMPSPPSAQPAPVHGGFRGTFLLDLGEGLAGGGVGRLDLGRGGESPDDHVAVARIELDAVEDTRQRPQSLYGLIFD